MTIAHLLCPAGVNADKVEAEVGCKSGVDSVVGRVEVKDELLKLQASLGNAGKIGEGVDDAWKIASS